MHYTDNNETQEYKELVERYRLKKTTDDCYTPNIVYEAVKSWTINRYGIPNDRKVVRPFFPGGDYENYDYGENFIVIDNPPFSILSRIIRFYTERHIDFFLFAPTLTCFNAGRDRCNYVITDSTLTYDNGARIRTSFVTNLGEYSILSEPEIDEMLNRCEEQVTGKKIRKLVSIDYPDEIATTSNISSRVRHGIPYRVKKGECAYISHVGDNKQSIFGGGMILSEEAAHHVAMSKCDSDRIRRKIELSKHDRKVQENIHTKQTATQCELIF